MTKCGDTVFLGIPPKIVDVEKDIPRIWMLHKSGAQHMNFALRKLRKKSRRNPTRFGMSFGPECDINTDVILMSFPGPKWFQKRSQKSARKWTEFRDIFGGTKCDQIETGCETADEDISTV